MRFTLYILHFNNFYKVFKLKFKKSGLTHYRENNFEYLKKIASKNIENCMSYRADRGGKSSFEKNAFKVLSAFCSKSRATKARNL